ncbi:hypothetical protein BDV98DRAFT_352628 [Pterulicium gracile]|uniref:Uncharacterized protein n=1 Tax=Pterulicium gracile TaxID=1884261 RepID=A0A5C3QST3_9AGAR|nr:hypothetical protein BDV98DRAFT_352628 [Pterula gracilis]
MTTPSFQNPLHVPLHPSKQSSYSTLLSPRHVVPPSAPPQRALFPRKKIVPQHLHTATSKWKAAMSQGRKLAPITFDYVGYTGQGIPMCEIASRASYGIEQLLDRPLDTVGSTISLGLHQHVTLKIFWPGYPQLDWTRQINLTNTSGKPITRAQLASAVSLQFARFFEKAQFEQAKDAQWRIGVTGITFDSMILLSLTQACDNVWVAEVATGTRA